MKAIVSVLVLVIMCSIVALLLGPKYVDDKTKREAKIMLAVAVAVIVIGFIAVIVR